MSSPSSYQKMAYGIVAGIGKEFFTYDDDYYFTFMGGYKFVRDNGFGASTVVSVPSLASRNRYLGGWLPSAGTKDTLWTRCPADNCDLRRRKKASPSVSVRTCSRYSANPIARSMAISWRHCTVRR